MQDIEKTQTLSLLATNQEALLQTISHISPENFLQSSAQSTWTLADIVEHICLVESGILANLKKLISEDEQSKFNEPPSQEKVLMESASRGTRVTAPSVFEPKSIYTDNTAAAQGFIQTRERTIQFVQTNTFDLATIAFPHRRLGMYNGQNWLAFIVGHCRRHIEQIEEIQKELVKI